MSSSPLLPDRLRQQLSRWWPWRRQTKPSDAKPGQDKPLGGEAEEAQEAEGSAPTGEEPRRSVWTRATQAILVASKQSWRGLAVLAGFLGTKFLGLLDLLKPKSKRLPWQESRLSFLYFRIFLINLAVLAIPIMGLLWADRYREALIEAEIESLRREAVLIANSLGEGGAVIQDDGRQELVPQRVNYLALILARNTNARLRIFRPDGELLSDSFLSHRGSIPIKISPIRDDQGVPFLTWLFDLGSRRSNLPAYVEPVIQTAESYEEAEAALSGTQSAQVRVDDGGNLVVSVGVPVRAYRRVLGSLMLSRDQTEIEAEVNAVRLLILQVFLVALVVTIALSVYLGWTIARPIRRLALATDLVRTGKARQVPIPDFSYRRDEIGDLSVALREMTDALWQRLSAIESFAADVSHELKNPLTSLRSAVETAKMVKDPEKFKILADIIINDVDRMDRLITDISNASRIDAEMSRSHGRRLSIVEMLNTYADSYNLTRKDGGAVLDLDVPKKDALNVLGLEGRLGQVLRNLVTNAASFSPENGRIHIFADRVEDRQVLIMVEDEGPGLPEGKEEKIFSRFFTDRPDHQGFGNHSGLGLSICRQIIEAHKGQIWAETMRDENGEPRGARFSVLLPAYRERAQDARSDEGHPDGEA